MNNNLKIILTLITLISTGIILNAQEKGNWAIVLHGGAGGKLLYNADGSIKSMNMSADKIQKYEEHLTEAINIGKDMLKQGKPALEVAQNVVIYLEDCPMFNAFLPP